MKLPRFKSKDIFDGSFSIDPGFGWDMGPPDRKKLDQDGKIWPRIHVANDYQSCQWIRSPLDFDRTEIIEKDSLGCSVLRLLIGKEFEIRMVHINISEMINAPLYKSHGAIQKGKVIAPTGNTGLSFGANGGRHLHCMAIASTGVYDEDLDARFGTLWRESFVNDMEEKYGERFKSQMLNRGISKINSLVLWKYDPYWGKEVMVFNISKVFD